MVNDQPKCRQLVVGSNGKFGLRGSDQRRLVSHSLFAEQERPVYADLLSPQFRH